MLASPPAIIWRPDRGGSSVFGRRERDRHAEEDRVELALQRWPTHPLRVFRDSALEEDGFELVVPLSKRTAVPSSPFGFPVDGTGCERSNLRKRRFRVPGSQGNLARQGTCVVLNGWCIEACVGGVTGWAIGAAGARRKPIRD